MEKKTLDRKYVSQLLNRILEMELSSTVRFTHYSFMIFGHGRIPIVHWLREQAEESLQHAYRAGEMITHFGEPPSLSIGPLLETHNHDIDFILKEAIEHEGVALQAYRDLLDHVAGRSVFLEEYARELICEEESHAGDIDKMLRHPGDLKQVSATLLEECA